MTHLDKMSYTEALKDEGGSARIILGAWERQMVPGWLKVKEEIAYGKEDKTRIRPNNRPSGEASGFGWKEKQMSSVHWCCLGCLGWSEGYV